MPFARAENVVLFARARDAESAGFQPCKRCKPQVAQGSPAWLGTSAVVSRALRLIVQGALNEGNIEQLGERVGLGSRQLRRLFVQHLGIPPLKIATAQRVRLALKLIKNSRLCMTEIAYRSGFKSIREFNHAIRSMTRQSPTGLRKSPGNLQPSTQRGGLELKLPYQAPFDWHHLLAFLGRNAMAGVEVVSDASYKRTICIGGAFGFFTVRDDPAGRRLIVNLEMSGYEGLADAVKRIRDIFDLSADPLQIARHLAKDPRLRPSVQLHPGLRVPGVWDSFEGKVLAVLGRTLTASGPRNVIARLVKMFGTPVDTGIRGLDYLFPRPDVLAVAQLSKTGMRNATAEILRKLSLSTVYEKQKFTKSKTSHESTCKVRADFEMIEFTEPDAFPADERAIRHWLSRTPAPLSVAQTLATAEQWRPWRAYAAMHIAITCLETGSR